VACGGTRLESAAGAITSELVWNDPADGATGGGVSEVFARPAYQRGAKVPRSASGHVGRGVPDVAGDASPATGYRVRVDGQEFVIGGTSAVAPLWAGLIARINQQLGRPVGFLNPLLYTRLGPAGILRDITAGNNDSSGRLHVYQAAQGWDACTGWGSPDGAGLVRALGGRG
jgi:kumamolisin